MNSDLGGRVFLSALLVCAILGLGTAAAAQSSTDGAIGGVVMDQQKAVVPNAAVTVRNVSTGREDTGASDATGRFRIIHLQPSAYLVGVTRSGFALQTVEGVIVEVGRVTDLEVTLGIAARNESVEVPGEAPVVQTEQQDFSTNVNQASIDGLPVNGRRWSSFALLTPGVAPDGDFGLISFRGISGLLNNNTVDGADNNQAFFAEERGRTRISFVISQAAIREFQVNTSNYSAEYGRAAGGVVNAVTKSGTNRLHGQAFYYNRNNVLGATNPFTTAKSIVSGQVVSNAIKPANVRQQFGAAVGGPILHNRLFFFFSYDQQKHNFPGVATTSDPNFLAPITVAAPPAGKTCGSSGLAAGEFLGACGITQAQSDAANAYLLNLTGTTARRFSEYTALPKFDWQVSKDHRISIAYNRMRWNAPAGVQTQAVVFRSRDGFGNDFAAVDSLIGRLSSAFGKRISNELRLQWGRDRETQFAQQPLPGQPNTGLGGEPPEVCIGCSTTGSTLLNGIRIGKSSSLNRRALPDEKRVQLADTLAISRGRHLLKFGGDFNHVYDLQDQLFFEGGAYSYSSLVNFIVDFNRPAARRYASYQQGFGVPAFHFTTADYNFFAQDDWRVSRRLTLSLGARYEYEQLPNPQSPNPAVPQTSQFPSDKNNFGPRIGFALDLFGDGKTALRGGYGVYYGRIINSTIINAILNTGLPTGQNTFLIFPSDSGSPLYPATLAAPPNAAVVGTARPDIVFFQPNYQVPTIQQSDLILEREVAHNTVLSASWLFSKGSNLPIFLDQNLTAPSRSVPIKYIGGPLDGQTISMPVFAGSRPNPAFGQMSQISSVVESNYNAAVVQLNRRLSRGLQFQTHYTFSHALDTGHSSTTFTAGNNIFDVFNLNGEHASSNFDVRHRFVSSIVWSPQARFANHAVRALADGWTLAPIFTTQSGRGTNANVSGSSPISGTQAGGVNGSGGSNRVPALPRNFLQLPGTYLLDARLSRRFRITEGKSLEVLAEAFNLTNHVNPTSMLTTLYSWGGTAAAPTLTSVSSVGTVNGAGSSTFKERQIQFAVRFHF